MYRRGTLADAFHALNHGETTARNALGDFLDGFYSAVDRERLRLIAAPLEEPKYDDARRWASYFVASAHFVAVKYGLPVPAWVLDDRYVLPEPWFLIEDWHLRAWQLIETPPPFKMRNVFCGDRVLQRV